MKTKCFTYFFYQKLLEQSIKIALFLKLLRIIANYVATLLHFKCPYIILTLMLFQFSHY